jgi:extradiol dioxygenase family protein
MYPFHILECIYLEKILMLLSKDLKDNGTKYYDEPYLRFKGTKYEQETFFVKDPNENILEIKTLTANPE